MIILDLAHSFGSNKCEEGMSFSQIFAFWRDEQGQDLIEYSLLMTFIAIACLAYLGLGHSATAGITSTANSQLVIANSIAAGS